eukprot:3139974-Rhodomonas_salina.1
MTPEEIQVQVHGAASRPSHGPQARAEPVKPVKRDRSIAGVEICGYICIVALASSLWSGDQGQKSSSPIGKLIPLALGAIPEASARAAVISCVTQAPTRGIVRGYVGTLNREPRQLVVTWGVDEAVGGGRGEASGAEGDAQRVRGPRALPVPLPGPRCQPQSHRITGRAQSETRGLPLRPP